MLAKSFVAQGRTYGFTTTDYVRFVNVLLELAMLTEVQAVMPVVEGRLPIYGARVAVRAFSASDVAFLHSWLSDPDGRFFLLSRTTSHVWTVDELIENPHAELGIITENDGRPIGAVAYLSDAEGQRAELRKLIGVPEMRGKGLGTDAARLWVAYGLQVRLLRKIYLYTLATNEANIRLNEQLGFRIEGVLRDEVVFDGQRHDLVRMARVA